MSLQCLSALGVWGISGMSWQTMPRLKPVFNAFRLWVFGGWAEASGETVPAWPVFNAFRLWVFGGWQRLHDDGLPKNRSSMPFGFGCLGDLKYENETKQENGERLQCLSALGVWGI